MLQHGQDSAYAAAFDIDWEFGGGKVRIPVLGSADDVGRSSRVDGRRAALLRQPLPDRPRHRATGTPQEVHDRQHYELVDWRRADSDLNYRRFFAINTLAGLRVEDPAVFDATHELVLQLVRDGAVDGLRIDHPDGLADPKGYLDRLAEASRRPAGRSSRRSSSRARTCRSPGAIAGTTGYDALAEVDERARRPGRRGGADRAGHRARRPARSTTRELVHDCKREVTDGMLGSEVARLVRVIGELPGRRRRAADRGAGRAAGRASPSTAATCPTAASTSTRRSPRSGSAVPTWSRPSTPCTRCWRRPAREAATRFEQTSGPVMAKGVEDSAYYRWARFVALNEVGGDPARFGSTGRGVPRGAAAPGRALARQSMTTLSTHDTKRSEDVRARLAVLAELPTEWAQLVRGWLAAAPAGRPAAGPPGVAEPGRRVAAVAGAGARLRREGGPRGRHLDDLDRPRRGVRGPAARAGRRRLRRRRRRTAEIDDVRRAGSRRSAGRTRWRRSCCS